MRRGFFKLRPRLLLGLMAAVAVTLSFAGCWKKGGKAVVLEKEHIAAREITPTPKAEQAAIPSELTASSNSSPNKEEKPRAPGKDEIVVDTYVMNKDVRGTSRDPRATSDEQWIVKVQMIGDLRRFDVHTDRAHWDRVKIGDQIKVSYHQGKYTGTVWSAEID